jgi:hypothetical protein
MIKKHKNLFLFFILILFIAMTYWFEERGANLYQQAEAKRTEVLNSENLGSLKAVTGIKIDIEKKGDQYFSRDNKIRLSNARLDEFFKILGGLKVKTFLTDEDVEKVGRKHYIPDDLMRLNFHFEKGEIEFTLGKKLDFDQSFYMEVTQDDKKKIVIVNDESPDPGAYQSDKDYQVSDLKYKRLQMIFMLTNVYFYDSRVFKDLYTDEKSIHFDHISISTFRNKKFIVNFKETKTLPEAPKGIAYFEDNWLSFHKSLSELTGRTVIYPYEESVLNDLLSQFEIVDREGRSIILTLYKKFGEQNGYFLTSSLDKLLYVLKPEEARFFFVNVQDFWKKSLFLKNLEYQMSVTFFDNITETVKIIDKELFNVVPAKTNLKVRPLEFKKLIDFLKSEGDHVSELTEKPSEILKKNIMRLSFDNKVMSVILEDNDAILVDYELKVKIHHYIGANIPFSIKRSDYFE